MRIEENNNILMRIEEKNEKVKSQKLPGNSINSPRGNQFEIV